VVERVLEVIVADGQKAGGSKPLVERVGERVADPPEVRLAGAVVEGQHQHETARALRSCGLWCGLRGRVDA